MDRIVSSVEKILFAMAAALISGCASIKVDNSVIAGSWICDPYSIESKDFKITVHEIVDYNESQNYSDLVLTIIEFKNGEKVASRSSTEGSWSLTDNIIHTHFSKSTVLTTDNPLYPIEILQKAADDQLQKKNWSKSKVIEVGDTLVTQPMQLMYEEANVVTKCKRSENGS